MFGASAASTEPPQKMPTPISITRLRPNSSPTMPNASMAPAKVSAYALTTHCRALTPACSSVCTLPSATLTIVLSRKVRNSTAASTARASDAAAAAYRGRPPGGRVYRPDHVTSRPTCRRETGVFPLFSRVSRPQKLASPTFQVPPW